MAFFKDENGRPAIGGINGLDKPSTFQVYDPTNSGKGPMQTRLEDGASVAMGSRGDVPADSDTAAASLIALVKRLLQKTGASSAAPKTYENKGLVIDQAAVAAGAWVYSPWFTGLDWVNTALLMTQSDQAYDINVTKRDPEGIADWGTNISTNNSATGLFGWRGVVLNHNVGAGSAAIGAEARWGLKNAGASASTLRMRLQLLRL